MTAKAARTSRLPDNVDFSVGSTVLHIYLTAYYALVDRARVEAGETVLVTGASGGVGLACVELAHFLGARVIGAVGSAAKASIVRDYGAEAVINYSEEDVRDRARALTAGEGLDVCVDNVGGAMFGTLARLMRWNGRLLPIGFASGEVPSLHSKSERSTEIPSRAFKLTYADGELAPSSPTLGAARGSRRRQRLFSPS
jgi:NADPH2:quinone reductase